MKLNTIISLTFASIFAVLLILPDDVHAQDFNNQPETSNITVGINLSLPTHYNPEASLGSFRSDLQDDLFSNNLILGLNLDYFFSKNWAFSPAVSFSHSKANQNEALFFIGPPPPSERTTIWKTDYAFYSASVEPKIKFFIPNQNFDLFWAIGPIASYGSLSAESRGATFGNPENFRPTSSSNAGTLGYGGQVSTGIQFSVIKNISMSAEVGYRYVNFSELSLQDPIFEDQSRSYNYTLSSFTPSIGVGYKF